MLAPVVAVIGIVLVVSVVEEVVVFFYISTGECGEHFMTVQKPIERRNAMRGVRIPSIPLKF